MKKVLAEIRTKRFHMPISKTYANLSDFIQCVSKPCFFDTQTINFQIVDKSNNIVKN